MLTCPTKHASSTSIMSKEESLHILEKAHAMFTFDCCPDIPPFAERVRPWKELEGVYPVYTGETVRTLLSVLRDVVREAFSSSLRSCLLSMIDAAQYHLSSREAFMQNRIPDDVFQTLKTCIKDSHTPFQLIKRSSPKWSNLIASILKYAGRDPEHDSIMKAFHDRGSVHDSETGFELIISTEPHRIAGMSAFGHYTSCQDWRRKIDADSHHVYTHRAWANLKDPTMGVAYIRGKRAAMPTLDDVDVTDMLARSIVRVVPLPGGITMLFFHRIYAKSPYGHYLRESLRTWVETLPDHYKAVYLFEDEDNRKETPPRYNSRGVEVCGWCQISVPAPYGLEVEACVEECWTCYGTGVLDGEQCECGGNGECADCNGVCSSCNGTGTCSEYVLPYNDHSETITFNAEEVSLSIPAVYVYWNTAQEDLPELHMPAEDISVGDWVRLRTGVEMRRMYGKFYMHPDMYCTDPMEVVESCGDSDSDSRLVLSNGLVYPVKLLKKIDPPSDAHLRVEKLNVPFRVGDKVKLRPDMREYVSVWNSRRDVRCIFVSGMWFEGERTIQSIIDFEHSGEPRVGLDGDVSWYWYHPEMLVHAEEEREVRIG